MAVIGFFIIIAAMYVVARLYAGQLRDARKQAELGNHEPMDKTIWAGIGIIFSLGYAIVMTFITG